MAWVLATVVGIRRETARAATFRLRFAEPLGHRPGQHLIVRLTAPDGYTASRAYSIATPPDPTHPDEAEITVELLDGGEVSGFLHEGLVVGDELEVRGPIGGWFVWDGETPALLLGGGSGVVPLMAMLRAARAGGADHPVRLVVSARRPADLFYAGELTGPDVTVVFTREAPADGRPPGRITVDDVRAALPTGPAIAYVCGSSGFCETATRLLEEAGHPTDRIRIERYGPSAG